MRNYGTSVAHSRQVPPKQLKTFAVTDPKTTNEAIPLQNGIAQESPRNEKARVNTLLARYYPALYSFAARLTDDPSPSTLISGPRVRHHAKASHCDSGE